MKIPTIQQKKTSSHLPTRTQCRRPQNLSYLKQSGTHWQVLEESKFQRNLQFQRKSKLFLRWRLMNIYRRWIVGQCCLLDDVRTPENHLRGISIIRIKFSKFGLRFTIIRIKIANFSKNLTLVNRINLADFWRLVRQSG